MFSLGLYEKAMPNTLSLDEKLFQTRKAGFDFLEISIDETDEKLNRLHWNSTQKNQLIHAMEITGTRIKTMCLSGHRKFPIGSERVAVRNKGMTIMSEAIDLAAALGIRIIQLAGYDEYYHPSNEETKHLFLTNLCKSIELAASSGVVLAFETMETDFMNTVEKAINYIQIIHSPFLQLYPDLGNLTNAAFNNNKDVLDDLAAGQGHIVALHLKETVPGIFREIPFGEGHVAFKPAIKFAQKMGVRIFTGEFWYTDQMDWKQQLLNANTFLRKQFT